MKASFNAWLLWSIKRTKQALKDAFIYGLYYQPSFKLIKDKNYIDILIDRFDYKDSYAKKQMEDIRKKAKSYLDKNIRISDKN